MIKIDILDLDKDNYIMYVEKNGKNIWAIMGIMQYEEEMEYYGIETKLETVKEKKGYVFSKDINKELIYEETNRFVQDHNLDERDLNL